MTTEKSLSSLVETIKLLDLMTTSVHNQNEVVIQEDIEVSGYNKSSLQASMYRMLQLTELVGGIEESLSFGVRGLYEIYSKRISTYVFEPPSTNQDVFSLKKAVICVTQEVCASKQHELKATGSDFASVETHPTSCSNSTIKKRTFLPKPTKDFLEEVFKKKSFPNREERYLIAKKSDLTPLQVRVWFTNKRTRTK